MLLSILARSSWRFYQHHPAQLLLSIVGIVLGVGIVTAVLITNNSSQRAFALSSEAVYGRTTHQISGANGIEQSVYVQMRKHFGFIDMAPAITGHVAIGNHVYTLLGLDPFAEAGFNRLGNSVTASTPDTGDDSPDTDLNRQALLRNDALFISLTSSQQNNLPSGQAVVLKIGNKKQHAFIAATFNADNPATTTGLLVADIAFAQTLLGRGDRIDRIDLILDEHQARTIEAYLPDTLQLTAAASRTQTMQAMTRGFHINLTAMSLLALVVGAFLIHNTMTFAVVQRREVFAIKRITGITARTILCSVLLEAFVISTVASLIGVALGYALSSTLVEMTTRTINDLYFVLHLQQVWFSPWLVGAGLLLGVGSSVLAATLAACEAASSNPVQARQRSVLEQRTHRLLPVMALIGAIVVIAGLGLAVLPVQSLLVGFIALMLIIVGYGLFIPWIVYTTTRRFRPWLNRLGIVVSLAAGGIYRNISRTGLAIAALSIAVSATFGVDIMIGSFRTTVDQWLRTTLQSDIYVTAPSELSTQDAQLLPPDSATLARSIQGVASVSTGRTIETRTAVGTIDMLVVQPHAGTEQGFELLSGITDNPWQQWSSTQALMISEPLASKHGLQAGGTLQVFTQTKGFLPYTISAVFRDYGSSHGKLLMARQVFDRHWQATGISSLGILLEKNANDTTISRQVRRLLSSPEQPLMVQSNTAIHRQSLQVFDRTFEVTRVLRWLTVGVAFLGIFSTLLALNLERAREFAIVRASGATRRRIISIMVVQSALMGLLSGLLALPLGWLMSEVLINVINVRSFGWSMQSNIPVGSIPETLLLAGASAILAGLYPAYRLSRSSIAAQLRDE